MKTGKYALNVFHCNAHSLSSDPPVMSFNQPQFIGTYSFVQPYKEKCPNDSVHSDSLSNEHHDQSDANKDNNTQPTKDTTPDVMPVVDPGSHIYQTLDKYIEELECYVGGADNNNTTGTTQDSYDRLFDDPNYSPLCASNTSSLLPPVPPPPDATTDDDDMEYDKLATAESREYEYAYAHMAKKKRKKDEARAPDPRRKGEELLKIAEMGKYEMDPEFISTLRSVPEEEESLKAKPRVVEPSQKRHCYQPLDQKTLTPDNSYTTLNK